MSGLDAATMLAGYAFMFAMGLAIGLSALRTPKPHRARTCGTCAYCEINGAEGNLRGIGTCCRHSYKTRIGIADLELKRDSTVRLDWRGCGESEEKS